MPINFNFINANARSLNNKIESLIELFNEYELSAAILTETWFKNGRNLNNELLDLECAEDISIIARNRSSRGGGVAIAYNNISLNMKEYKIPGNTFEMVCAIGNTSKSQRKIAIVSIYVPPRQRVATTAKLKACLADGINKLKTSFDNPIILIGGDTNKRSLDKILEDFDDIKIIDAPATRNGAKLDETACNFEIESCTAMPPLQSPEGITSDHNVLLCRSFLSSGHHFTKKTFTYRPITDEGKKKFQELVVEFNWEAICRGNSSEAADELREVLDKMVHDCFPLVTVNTKSTDDPWITKAVKKLIRRRRRVFVKEGRSERWKRLKKQTEEMIEEKKRL